MLGVLGWAQIRTERGGFCGPPRQRQHKQNGNLRSQDCPIQQKTDNDKGVLLQQNFKYQHVYPISYFQWLPYVFNNLKLNKRIWIGFKRIFLFFCCFYLLHSFFLSVTENFHVKFDYKKYFLFITKPCLREVIFLPHIFCTFLFLATPRTKIRLLI